MAGFAISIDQMQLRDVENLMKGIKNGYPKVLSRSLNRTITGVRTDSVKEIQKEITPKAKIIRDTFKMVKATTLKLRAAARSTGKPVPLYNYKARQVKNGVTVQVFKKSARKLVIGAFIATVRGHTGVYRRRKPPYKTTKSPKLPWKRFGLRRYGRLPIKELWGPRVPSIMEKDRVMKPILKKAGDRLKKQLDSQLNYELSKLK